ncbi:MAG: acyl carrier protein [Beijerinckiaceae bacterium]|nr:acyl carrier protein [Beijerinckiaceae bacterium]MCI0735398.1 acyl carrier protein [Beijerinckiaceae bacterium]
MVKDDIAHTVTNYILEEFLPGESPAAISQTTPLISGGILDSIGTIKLVSFLEKQYQIEFKAHEFKDNLENISRIVSIVDRKVAVK